MSCGLSFRVFLVLVVLTVLVVPTILVVLTVLVVLRGPDGLDTAMTH